MHEINKKLEDALKANAEVDASILQIICRAGEFSPNPDHPYLGGITATITDMNTKEQGMMFHYIIEAGHGRQCLNIQITTNGISLKPTDSAGVRWTKEMPIEEFESQGFLDELRALFSNNTNLNQFGIKSMAFVKKYRKQN